MPAHRRRRLLHAPRHERPVTRTEFRKVTTHLDRFITRAEFRSLTDSVEQTMHSLDVQFTRIAQVQAELDDLKRRFAKLK
jgi:hypothetical protein